jgi:hypothetical protein
MLFGKADSGNELKDVLHDAGARQSCATLSLRPVVCAHDAMHAHFLRRRFLPHPVGTWRDRWRQPPTPIPDACQVVSRDDLTQPPGFDVAHFDEVRVEDEDVWRVPGDVLRCAFPFDGALSTTWVAIAVHIQPELCEERSGIRTEGVPELYYITVVAKEEFIFAGAEHPHWATRFTTHGKFLMARIVK